MHSQHWGDTFTLLLQYKEKEGNCNVPQNHKEDEENLGKWLTRQRVDKKNGELDTAKQMRLVEIGIVWDVVSQQWEDMVTLRVQSKDREGDCNVPAKHKEDEKNLGVWLTNRRTGKKNGKLDTEKQKVLEELGVVWSIH